MAPLPQENSSATTIEPPNSDGERIVISGMSGLYPESHNVKDFADILYNKINPIGKDGLRYNFNHPEVVGYAGKIPDIELFDAQFFRTLYCFAVSMDSMSRKIMEHTYQAIYDAGINPSYLYGRKIGVYVGSCFSETAMSLFYDNSGFGIIGFSKAMFANRISYWLNAKGPSICVDDACCSSTAALEQAYQAMTRGECEAAVVTGSFICLYPQSTVHYGRTLKLCSDGKTKAFSENADGCAKSEAISVLFLQKAKDAKDEVFDPTKNYLFILPGLEGLHERFRELCGRLKIRAIVLQPGLDSPNENLQDLAKKYSEVLLKKAGLTGHFYLMGYESGTAVALEVAGILEDNGLTGTIFCLGCTVDDFQKTLKEELKKYQTEDELRDAVLYHIYKLWVDDDTTNLTKALKNTHSRKDKVEVCVRMLLGKSPHSAQYARELIETLFARLVEVQKYRVTERRLRSKIVYLRAAGYSDSDLAASQRHSEHPLVVHQLSAPLPHAALDLRCAAIINDCLPREILDEYDNGNTCDLYNIQSGSFKI